MYILLASGFCLFKTCSIPSYRPQIPVYAVVIASFTACVAGLINIGSSAAFNDVISLSVTSLYASYIITEGCLLFRRCTGGIRSRNSVDDTTEAGVLV